MLPSSNVLNESEHHPHTGAREPEMPVDALREIAGDERSQRGAEVDAHVEDREAGVAPRVVRVVQRPDDAAHVRLEQSGADDDECQPGVEERQRVKREREVADGDDDAADEHTLILAEPAVGDDAADDRRRPHARRVRPVHRPRSLVVEAERVDHVENEERAHAVVAEALPHLGEEERGEAARICRRNRRASSPDAGCR